MLSDDIAWIAGLLEGEGSFGLISSTKGGKKYFNPRISLTMCDGDVVQRAAQLMGGNCRLYTKTLPSGKTAYTCAIHGEQAIDIMEIILPLMGNRRSERISEVVVTWSTMRHTNRVVMQKALRNLRKIRA